MSTLQKCCNGSPPVKTIIVGGGIGGLVAALALHRAGIDVELFEAVAEPRPLGVGINLLPHCVRVLEALGALPPLLELATQPEEQRLYNRFGQLVWAEPRGLAAGYKYPQLSIHRGLLQMSLLATARAQLGEQRIHTGHTMATFEQTSGRVNTVFIDRRTGRKLRTVDADLLVAADGIHSSVRQHFYPAEGPPVWNGALIWRGTTRHAPILSGRAQIMVGGLTTFIAYPIIGADGTVITNWAARRFVDRAAGFAREDWNRPGRAEAVIPHYADWAIDWIDIPDIVSRADAIFEYPMVDRDPLERWSFGHVTLLGDAAHPMVPLGSNGASQAILDAEALAAALAAAPSVEAALQRYEAARRPATTEVVANNRRGGPEVVVRIAEERAPDGFGNLEAIFPHAERLAISARYKQAAGFDLQAVNNP